MPFFATSSGISSWSIRLDGSELLDDDDGALRRARRCDATGPAIDAGASTSTSASTPIHSTSQRSTPLILTSGRSHVCLGLTKDACLLDGVKDPVDHAPAGDGQERLGLAVVVAGADEGDCRGVDWGG